MEIPNRSTKPRYFSYAYNLYSLSFLSKTLFSPKPSPNDFFNSDQLHSKPTSNAAYSVTCSSGSSSVSSITPLFSQSSQSLHFSNYTSNRKLILNLDCFNPHNHNRFRCFSVSSFANLGGFRPNARPKQVSEMIEIIRTSENVLESKLNMMNVNLSVASISEIFRVLNSEKVSALRFFDWIRHSQPEFHGNSAIYSLVIDNCGQLGDYDTMLCLLNEFRLEHIWLTKKAFGFVPVLGSNKVSTRNSVRRVVEVLKEVGGSCYVSGVRALIGMFSDLGSSEMARFVMEITEKNVSYYNILIREKCRRCDFEGVKDELSEMRHVGCDPNHQTYNYVLSSLCKNDKIAEACEMLQDMKERDCPPNALTFEIFVYHACKLGKFNFAIEFFDRMVSGGIEPRPSTHAALVKGYFNSQQYEEAYKFVVGLDVKHNHSSNMIYSLLVRLHQKKGNLVIARNILSEMIHKGLRPDFRVYMTVLKHLQMSGREDLATDLRTRFSSLSLQSSSRTG